MLTETQKNDLVHAILNDKRLALLGQKARESKFAEMRNKKDKDVLAYIESTKKEPVVITPKLSPQTIIEKLRKLFN